QLSRVGGLCVARLVVVHLLLAAAIDDAGNVRDPDVFALNAELDQQVEAGERRSAGARAHELDRADLLADDAKTVQHRGADDDRRPMLVVVEYRDPHALAAFALDIEALGRLDVLEIDAAERRLERTDDVDQPVRIAFVDFDVETVDAGEFLEQDRLALHHRLAGERTDRAESKDRRAVGDDADQVAARGEIARLARIADDFVAGGGDARRISEREVALVGQLLGRQDRDLARRMRPMVFERGLAY